MKSEKDTIGELNAIIARGKLAEMFMRRMVKPTTDEWSMIYGHDELTVRGMVEVAASLGFKPEILLIDNGPTPRCLVPENEQVAA